MSAHGFFQITQKVFIHKENKLLVMRDKKSGFGDLPGGRMNEDEFFGDWKESIKRELKEELSENFKIDLKPEPVLIAKHRVSDGNHPCIIIGYRANYISGEIKISDEHDFFEWVNVQDYNPENLFSEYMLDAVKIYLEKFKNAVLL
jgi:8-oxo-dGTP pyrophosphatase MutT (NUDIX family)